MEKTKFKVVTVGHIKGQFDKQKIQNWKSDVLVVGDDIHNYSLGINSDRDGWKYSDKALESQIPNNFSEDILFAIVDIPLEDNYYARLLSNNRVVFSFYEIKDILQYSSIPLENVILYMLYTFDLFFRKHEKKISTYDTLLSFTHDETRGCLFDMHGIKSDIVASCDQPIVCDECSEKLRSRSISDDVITIVKKEIKNIKKPWIYKLTNWIKNHPIWSMLISAIVAIILGCMGSLLAAILYDKIKDFV